MNIIDDMNSNFLIFDGAMGTMLQKSGLPPGELPEIYNIENPQVVLNIHKAYVRAGSQVITSNTFQANEIKLKHCPYSVDEIITAGVQLAKESGAQYVALDMGPTGQLLEPMGPLSFDDAYELYKRQVVAGAKAGADLILIETISDLYEAKAAILAAKENCNLPVFCTLTYQQDGRTFTGTDPLTGVVTLNGLGVDAIGINCSVGPKDMKSAVEILLSYAKVPVMLKPNAGLPHMDHDETVYDVLPADFAQTIQEYAEKGCAIFGGCCGTTPEYIAALVAALKNITLKRPSPESITAATSSTKTVVINHKISVIGERINPTGKKKLKEAIKNKSYDYMISEALRQIKAGADLLDVNVGLPEIDEAEMLTTAIKEIQSITNLPLQIDSSDYVAIERAARAYNGKPMINSVSGKSESMKKIFPIAKKYGALLVALTLDDKGIPPTAEERVKIAENILNEAMKYGIPKEDIIVDCLVLTASAQQDQVIETIKGVSLVKRKLGVKTVLGVSNVSFGLPVREELNAVFLAAVCGAGLDLAIINPLSEKIMNVIYSYRVLNGEDKDSAHYIEHFANASTDGQPEKPNHEVLNDDLQTIIIEGRKEECANIVRKLIQEKTPIEIIENYFIPALDIVGARYETGVIFLPQLIQSSETVKIGFELIKDLDRGDSESRSKSGKILLATVLGDIHDIGKNIVKMMLENYGYDVLDMGKDVPIDKIIQAVNRYDVRLIGLSALMTTTVTNMKETIKILRENGCHSPVMVGGAVLNKEYADFVGADYYAKDAQEGVKIASAVFEKKYDKELGI